MSSLRSSISYKYLLSGVSALKIDMRLTQDLGDVLIEISRCLSLGSDFHNDQSITMPGTNCLDESRIA